jgi:hypothetical protein
MSQPKIISLKDREKKVFASIVPTKDGRWMEIKTNYTFQSKKMFFRSEKDWLNAKNQRYESYDIVYNEREPYVSAKEKWQHTPIDSKFMDTEYLRKIIQKYKIKYSDPVRRLNLLDRLNIAKLSILNLEQELAKPENQSNQKYIQHCQMRLAVNKKEFETAQEKINNLGKETIQDEYEMLTRETTVAYLQQGNELVPVGYDSERNSIVCNGKSGKKFTDLNLPEIPTLWVCKNNEVLKVV